VHAGVVARPLPGASRRPSVVLGELPAGTYELYVRPDGPVRLRLTVTGGAVAEADWPGRLSPGDGRAVPPGRPSPHRQRSLACWQAMTDDLLARHRAVLPNWMTLYYEQPLEIVGGSGRRLRGGDGRTTSTSSPASSRTCSATTCRRCAPRSTGCSTAASCTPRRST
jgi:hypothetical protein